MKISAKIFGIFFALAFLGGVMAYLAGFFEEKIPIDFSKMVPQTDTAETFTVEIISEPLIERAAGTLRTSQGVRGVDFPKCDREA